MVEVREKYNHGRDKVTIIKQDMYFVPVVDGKEYSHVAETEDMALLIGLGIKYEGLNSKFPTMAARMLKIESKWAE